jgi:hypothetical protein
MPDKRRTTDARQTPETTAREAASAAPVTMPSVERVQQELASATSLDDFLTLDEQGANDEAEAPVATPATEAPAAQPAEPAAPVAETPAKLKRRRPKKAELAAA